MQDCVPPWLPLQDQVLQDFANAFLRGRSSYCDPGYVPNDQHRLQVISGVLGCVLCAEEDVVEDEEGNPQGEDWLTDLI